MIIHGPVNFAVNMFAAKFRPANHLQIALGNVGLQDKTDTLFKECPGLKLIAGPRDYWPYKNRDFWLCNQNQSTPSKFDTIGSPYFSYFKEKDFIGLSISGGESFDRDSRVEGVEYFYEEVPSLTEQFNLLEVATRHKNTSKVILSYDCPLSVAKQLDLLFEEDTMKVFLESICQIIEPSLWVFASEYKFEQKIGQTRFIGLSHGEKFEL